MNNRLKSLRKELGLTQQEFADRIGIKRNAVTNYEVGRNAPADMVVSLICREFNVNEEWLRRGIGEMFAAVPQDAIDELCTQYSLDAFDRVLIQEYLKMPAESRKALKDYIRNVMKRVSDDDPQVKINKEVEAYRKELEIEASRTEESSASGTTAEGTKMA